MMKLLGAILTALLFTTSAHAIPDACGHGAPAVAKSMGNCPAGYTESRYDTDYCWLNCPEPDKDWDGYTVDRDCDDLDRDVYGGMVVGCDAGSGANSGWRLCQENGNFTACTANSSTPFTCHSGSGETRYYNWATGSNSNDCSYASPCKDYLKFTYFYDSGDADKPSGHENPEAGDCEVFMDGTYTTNYTNDIQGQEGLTLRSISGDSTNLIRIRNYPGHNPVFKPSCNSGARCSPIRLQAVSWIRVIGITLEGVSDGNIAGLNIQGGDDVSIYNLSISDVDAIEDDNGSGLICTDCNRFYAYNFRGWDNFERGAMSGGTDANDRQAVLFNGVDNEFHYPVMFNTAAITDANSHAACIGYKHGSATGFFKVHNGIFWNCAHTAIGSGTNGSDIKYNRVYDSAWGVRLADFGGPTYNANNVVEYNTFINSRYIEYLPVSTYGTIGSVVARYNVVKDNSASYGNETALFLLATYGSDTLYGEIHSPETMTLNSNCFYNSEATALQFCDFCANGGAYGSEGALYTFANWQAQGFEAASVNGDPALDAYDRALSGSCNAWGYWQLTTLESTKVFRGKSANANRKTRFYFQ